MEVEFRVRSPSSSEADIIVRPDVTVRNDEEIVYHLDAKYKGRVAGGQQHISEADLYQALAFARASACRQIVLAYPRIPAELTNPGVGTVRVLEHRGGAVIGMPAPKEAAPEGESKQTAGPSELKLTRLGPPL